MARWPLLPKHVRVRVRVCIVWRNSRPSPVSCGGPFIKDGSKRVIWRIIPICPRLHAAQIPSPAILLPINSINYPLLGILCTVAHIILSGCWHVCGFILASSVRVLHIWLNSEKLGCNLALNIYPPRHHLPASSLHLFRSQFNPWWW